MDPAWHLWTDFTNVWLDLHLYKVEDTGVTLFRSWAWEGGKSAIYRYKGGTDMPWSFGRSMTVYISQEVAEKIIAINVTRKMKKERLLRMLRELVPEYLI